MKTLLITKPATVAPNITREHLELIPTMFTLSRYGLYVVDLGIMDPEKLVRLVHTARTVHAFLVRRIVLERVAAPLALRGRFRVLPVTVVLPGVRMAIVAVFEARFRVVKLGSAPRALAVRERFVVYLGMVLSHSPLGLQGFPAGRAVHTTGYADRFKHLSQTQWK